MPMADVYSNLIVLLNEWSIMLLAIISLAFTDFVSDFDLKYAYGGWFLYIVGVTITLNILLLMIKAFIGWRHKKMLLK